jgi:hypothetical protein
VNIFREVNGDNYVYIAGVAELHLDHGTGESVDLFFVFVAVDSECKAQLT